MEALWYCTLIATVPVVKLDSETLKTEPKKKVLRAIRPQHHDEEESAASVFTNKHFVNGSKTSAPAKAKPEKRIIASNEVGRIEPATCSVQ